MWNSGLGVHGRESNMRDLTRNVVRESLRVDTARFRPVSAIRRTVVLGIVLFAVGVIFGPVAGVNATFAAFIVGIWDRGQPALALLRFSAVGTLAIASVSFLTTRLDDQPAAVATVMILLAFGSGIAIAIDQRLLIVLVFCTLISATTLVQPEPMGQALPSFWSVLLGGGAQVVGILICWRTLARRSARRDIARVAEQIAEAISRDSRDDASTAMEVATRSLRDLEQEIDQRTDGEAHHLHAVMWAIDRLRITARRILEESDQPGQGLETSDASNELHAICTALRRCADNIAPGRRSGADHRHPPAPGSIPLAVDPHVAANIQLLESASESLLSSPPTRSKHKRVDSWMDKTRAAIAPQSRSLRHGIRMAATAAVASILALTFDIGQGSWIVVTVVLLLRPDAGPSLPRITMRAMGATLAGLAVVALIVLAGDHVAIIQISIVLASLLFYAICGFNYAIFVSLVSVVMILLPSLILLDPVELAVQRWSDLLLGCALSAIAMVVFPIWNRDNLSPEIQTYLFAMANWFAQLASLTSIAPVPPAASTPSAESIGEQTRQIGRTASLAGNRARATLRSVRVEPNVNITKVLQANQLLAKIGQLSQFGIRLEDQVGAFDGRAEDLSTTLQGTSRLLKQAGSQVGNGVSHGQSEVVGAISMGPAMGDFGSALEIVSKAARTIESSQ